MANINDSSDSYIDVRYSKLSGILFLILSVAPLIVAVNSIISLKHEFFHGSNFIWPSIAIMLVLIIFYVGITMPNRRYLRLDLENKRLMVFDIIGFWSSKHPYDSNEKLSKHNRRSPNKRSKK